MKAKPVEPVDGIGQKLVPAAFTLVLAILSVIPLGIPGYAQVTPNFVLMSIYYWTIYRPDHLPYLVVFLVGLLVDLLTFGPPGVTPFALLIVRAAVLQPAQVLRRQELSDPVVGLRHRHGRGHGRWSGALGSLYSVRLLDPRSFAFQAVLTVACYPVLSWVFSRVQRVMTR